MSELLQAGWRMREIAELTPWTRFALSLPRDKQGRLILQDQDAEDELPEHVKVDERGMRVVSGKRMSMQQMYRTVQRERGLSKDQIDRGWEQFKNDNPKMGKGGIRGTKKRRGKT